MRRLSPSAWLWLWLFLVALTGWLATSCGDDADRVVAPAVCPADTTEDDDD